MQILEYISELFQTAFAVRTLVVGSSVSVCAALLGVNLVLKRCSMIGDGLSHIGFGTMGIAAALGLSSPLIISIPLMLFAVFFLLRINGSCKNGIISGDSAIALVSVSSLAVGVIMLSRSAGNTDVQSFLFGTILTVTKSDFFMGIITAAVVLCLYALFYNRIFAVTFDEDSAKATGVKAGFCNSLLAAMTAVMIVAGMRIMGAMLISGLIVFPVLTSVQVFGSYRRVCISSAVVSLFCFNAGIILSYIYDRINGTNTPAGASVVLMNLAVFLGFSLIKQALKLRRSKH